MTYHQEQKAKRKAKLDRIACAYHLWCLGASYVMIGSELNVSRTQAKRMVEMYKHLKFQEPLK